ncbi:unnamed protein product [Cochlearia groenlandica]
MGKGKSSVGRKRKNPATPVTLSDLSLGDERGCPSETAPNVQQTASGGWGSYGAAFDIATSINRENENVPSQSGDDEDVTMDDVDTQKDVPGLTVPEQSQSEYEVDEVVHTSNDDQLDKEVDKSSTHQVYPEVNSPVIQSYIRHLQSYSSFNSTFLLSTRTKPSIRLKKR